MTESDIERAVALTLQRLYPPSLLLISEAQEYRQIICARLAACDCVFRIVFEEGAENEQWKTLGHILPASDGLCLLGVGAYRAVVVPFMSYSLAADIANGVLHTPFAQVIHKALCCGLPVLVLRYYCDPLSELNQLMGKGLNQSYVQFMQATLATLKRIGVTLCSLDELLTKLSENEYVIPNEKRNRRYITLNDIIKNTSLYKMDDALLTDAASDYIKNKK